jgi:hypothetical protein
VVNPNQILNDLNNLDEFTRLMETSNRPIGTLFEPRKRAGSCASYAKSYRRYGVQMNEYTPKKWFKAKKSTYRVVRRSCGPNKHVQTIQRAQGLVPIEHEGANIGDDFLTDC